MIRIAVPLLSVLLLSACERTNDQNRSSPNSTTGSDTTTDRNNSTSSGTSDRSRETGQNPQGGQGTTGGRSATPAPTPTPAPQAPQPSSPTTNPGVQTAPTPTPTPAPGSTGTQTNASTVTDTQLLSVMLFKDNQEVAVGRLAQQKATSEAAKRFADMLVNDHSQHAQKVTDTARAAGFTLAEGDAGRREFERMRGGTASGPDPLTVLEPLSGAEFDKRFGELMAEGHREMIQLIEAARPQLSNADVKTLAGQTLESLRRHEEMARQLGQ